MSVWTPPLNERSRISHHTGGARSDRRACACRVPSRVLRDAYGPRRFDRRGGAGAQHRRTSDALSYRSERSHRRQARGARTRPRGARVLSLAPAVARMAVADRRRRSGVSRRRLFDRESRGRRRRRAAFPDRARLSHRASTHNSCVATADWRLLTADGLLILLNAASRPNVDRHAGGREELVVPLQPDPHPAYAGVAERVLDGEPALDLALAGFIRLAVGGRLRFRAVGPVPQDRGAVVLLKIVGATSQFRRQHDAGRRDAHTRLCFEQQPRALIFLFGTRGLALGVNGKTAYGHHSETDDAAGDRPTQNAVHRLILRAAPLEAPSRIVAVALGAS